MKARGKNMSGNQNIEWSSKWRSENLNISKSLIIFMFLLINTVAYSQSFQRVADIDLKSGYLGFASWCDYNSDGFLDIFLTGIDFGVDFEHAELYKNNGDNSFSESNIALIPRVLYGDLSWGDFDNNGTIDLIYAGTRSGFCSENITKIYKNTSDTGFVEIFHGLPSLSRCCLELVDINNDGLLDIYYHGINSYNEFDLGVYKNIGTDNFIEVEVNIDRIYGPRGNGTKNSAKWVDFDNDGLMDVIIAMSTKDDFKLECYKNLGDFVFQKTDIGLPNLNYVKLAVGDINQDGLIDILVSGSIKETLTSGDMSANIYVFINNGEMSFNEQFRIDNIGVFWNSLELGDFDNDGYLDILYYGAGDGFRNFKLYKNNQNLTFSELSHSILDSWIGGASFGDFDNDNDLDILYYGEINTSQDGAEVTYIFKNTSAESNTNPLPPDSILAFAIGNDVEISWNKGSDDATLPTSLYSNLCVGTNSNPNSLISGYSLNGKLKTINLGNKNLNRNYLIKDFPEGNFKIKLQSIDNSYNASVFSDTIDFCIRPTNFLLGDTLSYCKGDSILIGVNGNYLSYLWNTGSRDSAIYVKSEGLYNLNITHQDGCISSEMVFITEDGIPEINLGEDTSIYKGETLILKTDIENASFLWSDGSQGNSIIINGKNEVVGKHLFWLKVTDEFGCSNTDTVIVSIIDNPEYTDNWNIKVYPTPFYNQITIESIYIEPGNTEIEIMDTQGRLVYKSSLPQLDYFQTISLSELTYGLYFLIITNETKNAPVVFKLIKLYTDRNKPGW